MLSVELDRITDVELKGRWTDWEPTQAQLRDISDWFLKFPYETVVRAIQKHRESNDYKSPNIGKIYGICKASGQGKNYKDTFCYAVFDGGYMATVIIRSGLNDTEDAVRSRATMFFSDKQYEKFGDRHENFIGEENYYAARSKSFELKKTGWIMPHGKHLEPDTK